MGRPRSSQKQSSPSRMKSVRSAAKASTRRVTARSIRCRSLSTGGPAGRFSRPDIDTHPILADEPSPAPWVGLGREREGRDRRSWDARRTRWRFSPKPAGRATEMVANRTKLSDTARMNKRDRFIAELKKAARSRGLTFKVETWRGKGGHAMVWVGDKVTTIPGREIDPKTASKIRMALGLD